jgi:formylglycine-generating enzyme required for sulfatase activity
MTKCDVLFPIPLPDDPRKWDGWNNYKSANLYERLCLDPGTNPTNELIEQHCRELLRWWQKKLPLKNQPSNPLAQMLRSGLEESSRYLTQARVELLDPERRRQMDEELAKQAHEEALAEFHKYLAFALSSGALRTDEEAALIRFGKELQLDEEEMSKLIDAELLDTGAERINEEQIKAAQAAEAAAAVAAQPALDQKEDFMRMLRLSALDSDAMTDDQRDAFINMAENLGIDPGDAEDMVDAYLEEIEERLNPAPKAKPVARKVVQANAKGPATEKVDATPRIAINVGEERARFSSFQNSLGDLMVFVPSTEFMMGSEAPDAAPNEKPATKVMVSRFYISRHLVTNAQYEQFDPQHARKRAAGAGDRHPVIYVSSLDATKFCQWLGTRERRRYRLPTEAEWEYAARGNDDRRYPWGNYGRRGDLANFADRNTVFAWSDRDIDDGFSETSPVGSFPVGVSPFGLEDMAGNVWEWCVDYYEPYRGTPRVNPRGPANGTKRVHRGGSWKSRFNSLRTTTRSANAPNYSCNDLGFRIVCECE